MRAETLHRLLVALTAASALATSSAARGQIRIGVAAPLTGQMEYAGEQWQRGAELAIAELNAAGGVLGQKLELQLADDYCDSEQGLAAAHALVGAGVVVAIGPLCSGAAIPASAVYEAAHIPFFTIATNRLLTERGLRFTFRTGMLEEAQATLAADYMVRQLGTRRIAIVHDTRAHGKSLAAVTSERLAALGIRETLDDMVQPGQLVFTDLIDRLRRSEIEVLYYAGYPREASLLRRQMAEAGLGLPMVASNAIANEDYGLIAGPAAEGTIITSGRRLETAEFSNFEAKFRAAYEADLRAKGAYAGAVLWAQAAAAAGTTDGSVVADALHSTTFRVFGVEAGFEANGDMQGPLGEAGLWVWRNGAFAPCRLNPTTVLKQSPRGAAPQTGIGTT